MLAVRSGHTERYLVTVAFVAGVDVDALLRGTQFEAPSGQGAVAFARGLGFGCVGAKDDDLATRLLLRDVRGGPRCVDSSMLSGASRAFDIRLAGRLRPGALHEEGVYADGWESAGEVEVGDCRREGVGGEQAALQAAFGAGDDNPSTQLVLFYRLDAEDLRQGGQEAIGYGARVFQQEGTGRLQDVMA